MKADIDAEDEKRQSADKVCLRCIYANGCFREGVNFPIDELEGANSLFGIGCLEQEIT